MRGYLALIEQIYFEGVWHEGTFWPLGNPSDRNFLGLCGFRNITSDSRAAERDRDRRKRRVGCRRFCQPPRGRKEKVLHSGNNDDGLYPGPKLPPGRSESKVSV